MKLYLCEKPSQGRDIATFIGATQRGDGYLESPDKQTRVTWGVGHLVEQVNPEDYDAVYKRWSLEHLPIVPQQWQMRIKKETAKQCKIVLALIKQASHIVIATDPDREGEVIARELLDIAGYRGSLQRLWLSALDDGSIKKALATLKSDAETRPLYDAGLARSRADWLVGLNLSQLFTLLAQSRGHQGVLSVGRVQSPTLAIVVQRDREIANFVPKPFYVLPVTLANTNGQMFAAHWCAPEESCDDEGRCINQAVIQAAAAQLLSVGSAKIMKLETKRAKETPPLAFDLGTLQQMCSQLWGLGAQQVLDIAQSLYETHKATTYPRTDCGYLPESMIAEIPQVLRAVATADPRLSAVIAKLDTSVRSRVWNDNKITAHHGIIPTTGKVDLSKMNENELRVYDLVRRHYFAQFLPMYEEDRTEVRLQSGEHALIARGKVVVKNGWKVLFNQQSDEDSADTDQQGLPQLTQDEICQIRQAEVRSQQTSPPKPYTEGTLISAMKNAAKFVQDPKLKQRLRETEGLGTEATRAGVIETLLKRGYLVKQKKSIVSTAAAGALIDSLPAIIKDPGMTALWEQALNDIAERKLTLTDFMSKQDAFIRHVVQTSRGISMSISSTSSTPSKICPQCGAAMRKRKGANGEFWGCSNYPNCKAVENIGKRKKARSTQSIIRN
ncbi:DNA topoisomerase III [Chelonobacter oris]|uniref:DNA topoisomerase III n=1 Tax=Chelonobacter oris TaxID=505317 RepID=UPI00244C38D8|nr:DNA topoisomerase III [Chelonobacter oris]MDH3000210.1 DNA topoisomerase III [Chelonobacter oris]